MSYGVTETYAITGSTGSSEGTTRIFYNGVGTTARTVTSNVKTYTTGSSFYIYGTGGEGERGAGVTGYFYPLYIDEDDAIAYDLRNGGYGKAHSHTFSQYPNKTFYMPDTSMNHGVTSIPDDIRKYHQDLEVEKLSALIVDQFPDFYKEDGELFLAFIKAYYEYMEQNGKMTDAVRNLSDYRNIETTTTDFIDYFVGTFIPNVPQDVLADKKLLIKYINFYNQARGTEAAYKLLFRALYNETVEISYPSEQILRVSGGDWRVDRYLVSNFNEKTYSFIGKTIVGLESGAQALVEDIVRRGVRGRDLMQIYLSNIKGAFNHLEEIFLLSDTNFTGHGPTVEAGISDLDIVSVGGEYQQGDVVKLISSLRGEFGKVVVTSTQDLGGSITFSLVDGGSGYTPSIDQSEGSTTIEIAGGDATEDASFIISRGDITDTFAIAMNINLISSNNIFGEKGPVVTYEDSSTGIMNTFANTLLGAANFGFPEEGEEVGNAPYRDQANAFIVIANTDGAGFQVGDTLTGATSGANATILEFISGAPGAAKFRIDGYKRFQTGETVNKPVVGSVGTVTSFDSNTIGYHVISVGLVTGQSLNVGDEVRGAIDHRDGYFDNDGIESPYQVDFGPRHAFGTVTAVSPVSSFGYLHDGSSNTLLGGTVSSSSNTVTGTGTTFDIDFIVGDEFKAGGQPGRRIVSVTSNTILELDSVPTPALSGDAYGRGGFFRDLVTARVTSNTSSNVSSQFDTGPVKPFSEKEGIYKIGSSTLVGNCDFGSANTYIENIHTKLIDALIFEASVFGTIARISLPTGGSGYSFAPTVRVVEPDIASLGIGEQYITLQSDDENWGSGNSLFTKLDTNDKLVQANTGASGDVKGGAAPVTPISVTQYANGTYEMTVRVWQDFLQREPGNIRFANNEFVNLRTYDSEYVVGEIDTRNYTSEGTAKIVRIQDEGVLGKNAQINATLGANGTVTGLRVLDSGFSYRQNETVILETPDRPLGVSATVRLTMGDVANAEGYYSTTRGHISSKRGFIHDNRFYQEYSYQVISPVALSRYRDFALNLVHPAGQALFGKYQSHSNAYVDVTSTTINKKRNISNGTVSIAKTAASGTIAIQNGNTYVVGTSTDFVNEFGSSNNFIVEIDTGDGIENKFIEVTGTMNSSTNTVLSDPWIFGTQTSANIYYANSTIVTGSGTSFTAEFANNDTIYLQIANGNIVSSKINIVRSDTELTLTRNWTLTDLSSANAYYIQGEITG